ncbi:pyridoxal phosphate-dependent transferase [Cyathus striatus]|nr:pyridoxal phosphate-dependent transferase [Cyathus striatus]
MTRIDVDALYASPPPPFGPGLKPYFKLDPNYVNLNNGNPDLFLKLQYIPLLKSAREEVAKLIGAKTDEVVFVTNASTGVITALKNFEWEEGDVVIVDDGSRQYDIRIGVQCSTVPIRYASASNSILVHPQLPNTHAAILDSFRRHIQAIPKKEGKKRVAVIDSIIANPGVAPVEGDGESDPDFWVSNCHKWLHSKRSVAVFYVPERNQHLMKTTLVTSFAYISAANRTDPNFVDQNQWTGTIDYSSYLTVPDALKFRAWLGGEEKINAYCHDLALKGGKRLAELWGTSVMDPDGELTLNMVNVELPFPSSIPYSWEIDLAFRKALLEGKNAYSTHYWHNGKWWTRASVQVWNELEDFDKVGKAWLDVCRDVLEELKDKEVKKV